MLDLGRRGRESKGQGVRRRGYRGTRAQQSTGRLLRERKRGAQYGPERQWGEAAGDLEEPGPAPQWISWWMREL